MQSPVSPCSCCSSHGAEEQLVPGPCQYVRCCAIHTRSQHTMYHGTTAGAAGFVRLQPDPVHVRHRCRHTGTRAELRRAKRTRHEGDNAEQHSKGPSSYARVGEHGHAVSPAATSVRRAIDKSHCRQKNVAAGELRASPCNFAAGGIRQDSYLRGR